MQDDASEIQSLEKLLLAFAAKGCEVVYAKELAVNDDGKHGIYVGGDLSIVEILPVHEIKAERNKEKGPTFKGSLKLFWLNPEGKDEQAPEAQIILYAQYPEARVTSLVKGCRSAPAPLLAQAAGKKYKRIIFFGITPDKAIYAHMTLTTSSLGKEFLGTSIATEGVFKKIIVGRPDIREEMLLWELLRIHRKGWIKGKRFTSGGEVSYDAPNAGGFTLESELAIESNARRDPDFLGWEVKSHGVRQFAQEYAEPLTLFTQEPRAGLYCQLGVADFVMRFGKPSKTAGTWYFTGPFKATTRGQDMQLLVDGYDSARKVIKNESGGIVLRSKTDGDLAKWPFVQILEHLAKKHRQTVFVPCLARRDTSASFRFNSTVLLAREPDLNRFLDAVHSGHIYYDPGTRVRIEAGGKRDVKPRNQFRVSWKSLGLLFARTKNENLTARFTKLLSGNDAAGTK